MAFILWLLNTTSCPSKPDFLNRFPTLSLLPSFKPSMPCKLPSTQYAADVVALSKVTNNLQMTRPEAGSLSHQTSQQHPSSAGPPSLLWTVILLLFFPYLSVYSSVIFVGSSFSAVVQSCLTLWPHGLQRARLSCLSPSPRVYSHSCPLSQWCQPTISSSVAPSPPFLLYLSFK